MTAMLKLAVRYEAIGREEDWSQERAGRVMIISYEVPRLMLMILCMALSGGVAKSQGNTR